MRTHFPLYALLALAAAPALQANVVTLTYDQDINYVAAGGTYILTGKITQTGNDYVVFPFGEFDVTPFNVVCASFSCSYSFDPSLTAVFGIGSSASTLYSGPIGRVTVNANPAFTDYSFQTDLFGVDFAGTFPNQTNTQITVEAQANFHVGAAPDTGTTTPEPASWMLCAWGAAVLACRRRLA